MQRETVVKCVIGWFGFCIGMVGGFMLAVTAFVLNGPRCL